MKAFITVLNSSHFFKRGPLLHTDRLHDTLNFYLNLSVTLEQKYSLGHRSLLHGSISERSPRHSLPLFIGTGLIQRRTLLRIP